MRIIAGTNRGVPLADVGKGDAAAHLRPTSDRVRESLFSMLTHHNVISGARVLDLFAGTGALGLEALSRGARHVSFVENGRVAQRLIGENVEKLRVQDQVKLLRANATDLPGCDGGPFDLVFLDPPYGKSMGQAALESALKGEWIAEDAMIVWEESAPMRAPPGFTRLDARKYGDTHVTLLERA
ncbi:16S rRNA (guanine(966)-N(2))-methyltransferase RsmD [Sulfitobacter sp. SK012]|uniref:16S rRNA (guanine(966)-N(2))-methyltransferase RsmD n=1 Tax=Sulfitobacter sp. SK012 TaxID=1389005 RepID=UPI000E0B1D01|nr:16S rRNA (guanine(966)-N(2))-methyltransferase RsmD [Sulfitobacter sp. SK012]AXI48302.1 16S rRNA (guanine(966)-N(2))-methyltransferase RsmD [Sulfitobacter sp. SK012]